MSQSCWCPQGSMVGAGLEQRDSLWSETPHGARPSPRLAPWWHHFPRTWVPSMPSTLCRLWPLPAITPVPPASPQK